MICGLDLSTRGTGVCAVPTTWGLDWSKCYAWHIGEPLAKSASENDHARRIREIAEAISGFVQAYGVTHAVIEQYAYNQSFQQGAARLRELGGAVKVTLNKLHVHIDSIPASQARSLLGKAPRSDQKAWACARLVEMGAPKAWTLDELDAFAMANWRLADYGAAIIGRAV